MTEREIREEAAIKIMLKIIDRLSDAEFEQVYQEAKKSLEETEKI